MKIENVFRDGIEYKYSNVTLFAGSVAETLLLLAPPYVVHLPQGLANNLGFASLFSPPQVGQLYAEVNVPLLLALSAGITLVTLATTLIARNLESDA